MHKAIQLTQSQARKIILHAAGLSKQGQFGKGKEAVYKLINHLGFVQIDTNYIVERAHHHSIAARVPDYKPEWLAQLQAEGRIFESWTFASGYVPMHEFRFSLPVKASFAAKRELQSPTELNLMKKVLDRIAREGPLMARDFENDRVTKSSGWWDWRPSKVALERLNFDGRLITLRTKNFLKVYDLPENIIPPGVNTTMPEPEDYAQHVIIRSLKALGIANFKDIARSGWYAKQNVIKSQLQKMVSEGKVCHVVVKGVTESTLYMLPEYKNKKITLAGAVFILSPFDILNVFRQRLSKFFHFDYMVECFVPEPKRKYGYFSLPILVGDTFVARMDSKADRKQQTLLIHNLYFEALKLSKPMAIKIATAIKAFARFNQCTSVVIKKSNNKVFVKSFSK
jgi:uncharacterized protein